jgi:hypothetical protein
MKIIVVFSGQFRYFQESLAIHKHTYSLLKDQGYSVDILISTWEPKESKQQILDQCKIWDLGDVFIDFVDEQAMDDPRITGCNDNSYRSVVCRGIALEKMTKIKKVYDTIICTRTEYLHFHELYDTWLFRPIKWSKEKTVTIYGSEFRYKSGWDEFIDDNFIILPASLCYGLSRHIKDITYNCIKHTNDKKTTDGMHVISGHNLCYYLFTHLLMVKNDIDYHMRRNYYENNPLLLRNPQSIIELVDNYTKENFLNAYLMNQK